MRNIHNFWHKLHMTRIGKLAVRIAQCRAVGEQNRDLQHLIFTIFAKSTPLFEARETISQRIWSALLVQRFNQLIVLILWCADAWNGRYHCIRGYQQLFYAPILARICHEDIDFCAFESRACALHDRRRAFMHSSSFIVVLLYS